MEHLPTLEDMRIEFWKDKFNLDLFTKFKERRARKTYNRELLIKQFIKKK
jgi:hypothetical protein